MKHLKVLIVDDDPAVLEVLATFLKSRGYAYTVCENGREGLEAMAAGDYDLVVSDIKMAEVDGFQLLEATRARAPHIGFVLMTAYEGTHPMAEARRAGADGYIRKPFNLKKFSLVFERAYWNALERQESAQ